MKTLITVFSSFLLATFALHAEAPMPGEVAPDFTLTDATGTEHSLSDFKGKWVVLEWVNHGCPFVVKHYDSGNMQALQKKYTDEGVIWLSICSSAPGKQGHMNPEEIAKARESVDAASTAYLIDEAGTVGKLYNAKTTPEMYVINPDGKVVYHGAIDSIKSANKKDIEKADNYVAAALDAGMAGEPVSKSSTQSYGCSVKY